MADAGAIRAGKAAVEVSADDTGLQAGLARAQQRLAAFGQSVASISGSLFAVGAAGVAAFTAIGYAMVSTAAGVTHMLHEADSVGASFGFMSSLSAGLQLAGASAEGATQGIFHFNSVLAQAIGGSAQAQQAFEKLGIDANSLNNMTTDDRMDRISEAFGRLESHAEKSRVAMQLFGRGGRQMLDDLSRPGGLAATRREMEALGLTMSDDQAERWKDLNKSWVMLKLSATSLLNSVLEPLIPAFRSIMEVVSGATRAIRDWAKESSLAAITAALGAGEFSLAWEVGFAGAKLAFLEFIDFVKRAFWQMGVSIATTTLHALVSIREAIADFASGRPLALIAAAQVHFVAELLTGDSGIAEARAEFDELRRRANAIGGHGARTIDPDNLQSVSRGARGTFDAAIGFGLATAKGDTPEVSAIRSLGQQMQEQADQRDRLLERINQSIQENGPQTFQ